MSESREAQREVGKGMFEALGAKWGRPSKVAKTQIFGKGSFGKGREITPEVPRCCKEAGQLLGPVEAQGEWVGDSGAKRGCRKMLGSGRRGVLHCEDAGALRFSWGQAERNL